MLADGYTQLGLYLHCPRKVPCIPFEAKTLVGRGSNTAGGGRDENKPQRTSEADSTSGTNHAQADGEAYRVQRSGFVTVGEMLVVSWDSARESSTLRLARRLRLSRD